MHDKNIRLDINIKDFSYPDKTIAISNINLQVFSGDFIGILGANGSGKTTLLKLMDGLFKNYNGLILLDGKDIKKLRPREIYKKIGLVFQNPDEQLFAPTVFEDVAFGPQNMGFEMQEVTRRVSDALKKVDLDDLAHKPISNLSFGQKKRVCIAGLLAMGQGLLLLDEPTSGLDPAGEHEFLRLLTELNLNNNVTIVMATHNVEFLPVFVKRIILLKNGGIAGDGIPHEIFVSPERMSELNLSLPSIGQLFYELKHYDGFAVDKIPLSIGEARKEIVKKVLS
jgi:cobalt/nickel transport system ATP-binding protein